MWKEKLLKFSNKFEHSAWGNSHYERVYKLCLEIAKKENITINNNAIFAAAYLHDIGAFKPYKTERIDHADSSVNHYRSILMEIGFPTEHLALVGEIIRGHMFYVEPSNSLESKLFHDADTLDFMGTIGITRILSIVGVDDWTPNLRSALDLIIKFKNELLDRLYFDISKEIGEIRKIEMEIFLNSLSEQTDSLRTL